MPGLITRISYQGLAGPPDRKARSFTFRIKITTTDPARGSHLLVSAIQQPYAAFTTFATPAPPLDIRQGRGIVTALRITVGTCTGIPRGVSLPVLEVTLSNRRTEERVSFGLGATYAEDLEDVLTELCPLSVPRSPQAP
ncbi:hypothetical protein [Streptomyces sp. NPDC048442]|uniref:hypothetical protein n=1 Tax=Streptomyces sp. NPDC048442 TaxID=3154823 RepID=UPI003418511B